MRDQLGTLLGQFARFIAAEEEARATGRRAKVTSEQLRRRFMALLRVFGLRSFGESATQAGRTVGNPDVFIRPRVEADIIAGHESLVAEVEESIRVRMQATIRVVTGAAEQEIPRPSVGTIAQRIRRGLRNDIKITQGRAAVIARTEVQAAANAGRREGLLVSGVKLLRWVAIRDGFGRHDRVHGQVRSILEPFRFEGMERTSGGLLVPTGQGEVVLRYPAEPGGPANQVIQCRCTVVAHRVR